MIDRVTGINVLAINGRSPKELAKEDSKRLQKIDSIICRPSYQHGGCVTLTIAGRQYTINAADAVEKIDAAMKAQLSLFPEGLPVLNGIEKIKPKKQKTDQ